MELDLTKTNRRRLLLGLAASAAGAAAVITGTVASEPETVAENLELVRLGDMLPDVGAELDAANEAYRRAYQDGMALWPEPSDRIVMDYRDRDHWERDIAGAAIMPDGSRPEGMNDARCIFTVERLRYEVDAIDRDLRRKRTKNPLRPDARAEGEAYRDRTAIALADAEAYEAGKASAKATVRWDEVVARREAAQNALCDLARAILTEESQTMGGIVIKAQALTIWHRYPLARFLDAAAHRDLASELASAILTVAAV